DIRFDLRETIDCVYDQFIIKASQKKIELINDININVPNDLMGDPNRLKQVLTNLIGNAVKFTSSGFIYIGVESENINYEHVKLNFTIADTGIGITKESLEGIFEPFIQADGSTTRIFGGTGLGTTISKKIVNEMGGSISVDSPNTLFKSTSKGTVFNFDITFKLGSNIGREEKEKNIFSNMSALLIEDNSINLKIIERMLNMWGVESTTTRNMEEAINIAKIRSDNFDVLITDMILEDIYCDEVIRQLEIDGNLPDYVVIVSSDSNYNRVSTLRKKGFDIILKPLKQSSLFNVFKIYSENIEARKVSLLKLDIGTSIDHNISSETGENDVDHKTNTSFLLDESHTYAAEVENHTIKAKVLVAEDNLINMKIILKYLSKFDIEIISVSNGQEAVEVMQNTSVDLIFMDLQMPIMNGIDATKIIRENYKELVIIAITANAMEVHKKAIYEAGMNDFLSKPLSFENIRKILVKHLNI
ncbi:MAG: response regulator, partial [Acidaminobacteraceae bacterium]